VEYYYTTEQAAKILCVSTRRVQAMITAGRLRAEKLGRDWIIPRAALKAVRERKPGRPRKT